MKTGARLAFGLGVGFFLAGMRKMWLVVTVGPGVVGSRRGVLRLGGMAGDGSIASAAPDEEEAGDERSAEVHATAGDAVDIPRPR